MGAWAPRRTAFVFVGPMITLSLTPSSDAARSVVEASLGLWGTRTHGTGDLAMVAVLGVFLRWNAGLGSAGRREGGAVAGAGGRA